jgi:hypothetical protein
MGAAPSRLGQAAESRFQVESETLQVTPEDHRVVLDVEFEPRAGSCDVHGNLALAVREARLEKDIGPKVRKICNDIFSGGDRLKHSGGYAIVRMSPP